MRKIKLLILYVMLSTFILTSCGPAAVALGGYDRDKIAQTLPEANTDFAFALFKAVNKEDSGINVFISPLSISTALSMTYQGAAGATREAMAKALKISGLETGVLNESYKNLLRYLKKADSKLTLDIGNSVWIREGMKIEKEFLDINKDIFDAYVTELDFSGNDAADNINKWISKATRGKITKMIESPIQSDIIMYLIIAIYFKGQWANKFDKAHTFSTQFHKDDGGTQTVMMMSRYDTADFAQDADYKAVRLPYGEGALAMYCILPPNGMDINTFAEAMDAEKWNRIKSSIRETKDLKVQIPRFDLEYGIKNLNDVLKSMGMEIAFSDEADFSGIGDSIAISRVLHKAVIEVNEEGSTAAGVTVAEMKATAALLDPPEFVADRPFMFLIADDETGSILFMGKLQSL